MRSDKNLVFGGYAGTDWNTAKHFIKCDGSSFLFKLTHNPSTIHTLIKGKKEFELFGHPTTLLSFCGNDLHISNNCNANDNTRE